MEDEYLLTLVKQQSKSKKDNPDLTFVKQASRHSLKDEDELDHFKNILEPSERRFMKSR